MNEVTDVNEISSDRWKTSLAALACDGCVPIAMARKNLPRLWFACTFFLLAMVEVQVQAKSVISMNEDIGSTYQTTSGQPLTVMCTTTISGEGSAYVTFDSVIWKASNVSNNLDTSSPLWSVVYSSIDNTSYILDEYRMVVEAPNRQGSLYVSMGLTIKVPLASDTGMYYCSGSYVTDISGTAVTEQSNQIYLSVRVTSQVMAWMTISDQDRPSSPGSYYVFDHAVIRCVSAMSDNSGVLTRQQIYKAKNMTLNYFDGSEATLYWTGWTQIYDSNSTSLISSLPQGYNTNPIPPTWQGSSKMMSSIDIPTLWTGYSGSYKCRATYSIADLGSSTVDSDVFLVDFVPPPTVVLRVASEDAGLHEYIPDYYDSGIRGVKENGTDFEILTIVCHIQSYNQVPTFQLMMGFVDVTEAANVSSSSNLANTTNPTAFSDVIYFVTAMHTFNVATSCANLLVSCEAWIPGSPKKSSGITRQQIVSDICPQTLGNSLTSSAALLRLDTRNALGTLALMVVACQVARNEEN